MKSLTILVSTLTLLLTSVSSSIAAEQEASAKQRYATTMMTAEKSSVQESPENGKTGVFSKVMSVPASAAGVACGVMVGVPVAIARDTSKYTEKMRKSMIDGIGVEPRGDLVGNGFAFFTALPFGIGSGLVCGSLKGFKRGVEEGKQHPFSKESMSIKE